MIRHDVSEDGTGWAMFSSCWTWRYALGRDWGSSLLREARLCLVSIGLNPSKANAEDGDVTVTKEIKFAKMWNCTEYVKLNACDVVGTDPAILDRDLPLVGPDRSEALREVAARLAGVSTLVLAAWGSHPAVTAPRLRPFLLTFPPERHRWRCLGTTKDGAPRHTSRLGYATPWEPWTVPEALRLPL